MKILYFARIRQIAGKSSEELDVPASVTTVATATSNVGNYAIVPAAGTLAAERRKRRGK